MTNHLLDVISAGRTIDVTVFILFLAIVLVEAIVMLLFKLNNFWKCLLDSFVANLASMLAGYLITYAIYNVTFEGAGYAGILIAFVLSVLIELLVVKVMNRKLTYKRIWPAVTVMNIASYAGIIIWLALA